MVTKQAIYTYKSVLTEENKVVRAPQYQYARERYQRAVVYHPVLRATHFAELPRKISMVYAYTRKRRLRRAQMKETENKRQIKTNKKTNMRPGRRPSPEGTMLLFAGTINRMIYSVDGPTEGRHEKIRRKTEDKTRKGQRQRKNKTSVSMSSRWAKDDTRDQKEGRRRAKKP